MKRAIGIACAGILLSSIAALLIFDSVLMWRAFGPKTLYGVAGGIVVLCMAYAAVNWSGKGENGG